MSVHCVDWEDDASLGELGAKWAAAGLEPSLSVDGPCEPGDHILINGTPFRLIIVRKIGAKEGKERDLLTGLTPSPLRPYRYIVRTD